jgi:hypothetical protein
MAMPKRHEALLLVVLVACVACAGMATQVEASATAPVVEPMSVTSTTVLPSATPTLTLIPTYAPTETATQSIIEVTPLGGVWYTSTPIGPELIKGIYVPRGSQNVRNGPGIEYSVSYRIAAGKKIVIVAWLSRLPDEAWGCLDPKCARALALVYGGKSLGDFIIDD